MKDKLMIALVVAILSLFIGGCVLFGQREYADHSVDSVDLEKYCGKWYEIASFPSWFQRNCHCTTAKYTLKEGFVEVVNSCRKGSPDGEPTVAVGKARAVAGSSNSRFKVQFQWPFQGDYWVIALDTGYRYAMVGHPQKKYLWILSRTPHLDGRIYQQLLAIAAAKGYDISRLQMTDQSCGELSS
ncbi:lipocalin family protein [Desulfoferrobacter suflitae]|uniref:lipocalin family protein n=1 Tax=Desulfoferrobacter suflitae TaxID=2865782 RepID=UPI00216422CC|nr:lipocalin family protein [Desulfoferrobacter suflitae]MCK8600965.1 lipocalin family protein [Desulfoferrobacter suflitae]